MTGVIDVLMGVDIGTTSTKALVQDLAGRTVALAERPTAWTSVADGTETTAAALLDVVVATLGDAVAAAEAAGGAVRVLAVATTGLGESGVLLDGAGRPAAPVIAWFDTRGTAEVAALGAREAWLPEEFPRRSGLRWDCQASLAKLLWLRGAGYELTAAHRWLSVPEWVAHGLGAAAVREPSLASRTGLVDQSTGQPWTDGLAATGVPATLLPPVAVAGSAVGALRHPGLPRALQGAALTVAGHDHPVAAVGVGVLGADELFNSSGTADALARSLPGVLDPDRRGRLVAAGLSAGAHVLPGTSLLLGGVRGGLLLRRVLAALGAGQEPERGRLDEAALAVGDLPEGLVVSGAGPTGDDVVLRMRDGVTPAHVWAAATRYTATEMAALLDVVAAVVGPHTRAVACGGWTRMASVRAAKSAAIAHLEFSEVREPGLAGAVRFARQAAGIAPVLAATPSTPAAPAAAVPAPAGPAAGATVQGAR